MMSMTGEHRRATVVSALAACSNVVLNAVLIPRFGILGAAIATTVTLSAWNCTLYVMVIRIHGINPGILFGFRTPARFRSARRSESRRGSLVEAAGQPGS
jgi:O-antigen/teichoic acid export membrane protein